jgi:hypothetical protein
MVHEGLSAGTERSATRPPAANNIQHNPQGRQASRIDYVTPTAEQHPATTSNSSAIADTGAAHRRSADHPQGGR